MYSGFKIEFKINIKIKFEQVLISPISYSFKNTFIENTYNPFNNYFKKRF